MLIKRNKMALPKPRVRESKNRKKYWKKADITDVEAHLEDERFNERLGGSIFDKTDNQLFSVDRKSDGFVDLPKRSKKRILNKPLKCFANLIPDSKVPVPIQVSRVKTPDERKSEQQLLREREKQFKKLEIKTRNKLKEAIKKQKCEASKVTVFGSTLYDVWDEAAKEPEPDSIEHIHARYTKRLPAKVPARLYQQPSLLPPVEVPIAGTSYNPAYEDHQELLGQAVDEMVQKRRMQEKLERALLPQPADKIATTEEIMAEYTKGLMSESSESEEDEGESDGSENGAIRPPVRAEDRKSQQKRNREKRHAAYLREVQKRKLEKRSKADVHRIPALKKEFKRMASESKLRAEKRDEKQTEAMYKPKILSRIKYVPPKIEFKLTDELTGSLRTLKSEGSLLVDRYKSLQRRNIIEPRQRRSTRRQTKTKPYAKRGFKNQ